MNTTSKYTIEVSGYCKGSRRRVQRVHVVEETTYLKAVKAARRQARNEWAFFTCWGRLV